MKRIIAELPTNINGPEWYWTRGLHDAVIESIDEVELPYDVTKRKPLRNCLSINLDAKGALFDTTVHSILFYNYKILSQNLELIHCGFTWWLGDVLEQKGEKYLLNIDLEKGNGQPRRFTLEVSFDKAEVIRK